ncbi:4872_t:CDS:2 [Entrophospora sp. SA101]|nr:4872_t:CDS:2 [Entrophospora sp. SA101]
MGRPSKRQIQIKKLAQDKRRRSSDPTYVGDIEMDEDLAWRALADDITI